MTPLHVDHVDACVMDAPAQDDECLLLQRLAQGDREAFWGIWAWYQPLLYSRYCLRWMGGNREEAEDALSSACLKAWEHLPIYAWRMTNVKSWLIRLVYNHCMDIRRTYVRHTRIVQDASDRRNLGAGQTTSTRSPEDILCRNDVMRMVRQAMDHLPPGLRQPASLRFFRDMPYAEIADHLDLSPENARKKVQQARAMLKRLLHGDAVPPFDTTPKTYRALERQPSIAPRRVATRMVSVSLSSGVEWHAYLSFGHRPIRQRQRVGALSAYIHQHPEGWKKRLELGQLLYATGHWEDAVETYLQVVAKQPRCVVAWLGLGELYHLLARASEAIVAYEKALACIRQEATRFYVRGLIAACEQHAERAVQAFDRAAWCEPQNAAHWHALGNIYLQTGTPEDALRAYDRALQEDSEDPAALFHRFTALRTLRRDAEAERCLERVLQVDAHHALALRHMADLQIHRGRLHDQDGKPVMLLLQRALRLAPKAPDIHAAMATYYSLSGHPARGHDLLQDFLQRHPRSVAAWYYLARWQARFGAIEAAAEAILYADALRRNVAPCRHGLSLLDPELQHPDVLRPLVADMIDHFPQHGNVWAPAGQVILPAWYDVQ